MRKRLYARIRKPDFELTARGGVVFHSRVYVHTQSFKKHKKSPVTPTNELRHTATSIERLAFMSCAHILIRTAIVILNQVERSRSAATGNGGARFLRSLSLGRNDNEYVRMNCKPRLHCGKKYFNIFTSMEQSEIARIHERQRLSIHENGLPFSIHARSAIH